MEVDYKNLKRSKLFGVCEKRDEKLFDRYLKASTQLELDVKLSTQSKV